MELFLKRNTTGYPACSYILCIFHECRPLVLLSTLQSKEVYKDMVDSPAFYLNTTSRACCRIIIFIYYYNRLEYRLAGDCPKRRWRVSTLPCQCGNVGAKMSCAVQCCSSSLPSGNCLAFVAGVYFCRLQCCLYRIRSVLAIS